MAARRPPRSRDGSAPARRGPGRPARLQREAILTAAARLFRERGFRGTSIDEIGAALGTSGPALYRHFASKEALLEALIGEALARGLGDIAAVEARGLPPARALEEVVRRSVAHTLQESDLVVMADHEVRALPPGVRTRILREQGVLVRTWIALLRAVRPELSPAEARATTVGAIALIRQGARVGGLPRDAAVERFTRMALAALHAK
jgi:AcrR family transcriptional regulator